PAVEAHLRRFYRRSDRVLVPTGAVLDDMAAAQGRDRLAIWSRGVDTALFDPAHRSQAWRQRHGIGDDRIAILFFGRIVLEKGLDRFAETVALLRTLGHAVQPVIVGEGPARARLQAALPDAVFTGHLVDESLAVAVASCDMMINPSVTETFGNVSLEAMASGLAVVAARVPSSANLIDHGVSGLIADGHDAIAMAAQAQRAIVDPALRQRLGSAARAAAMGRGWDSVLDTVLDSYATVLGRGGAA
ncbi:MAG: glycosyltransferase, partial [Sphingobium sp.]